MSFISVLSSLFWGDLVTLPLPGGGSIGLSLLVLILIPACTKWRHDEFVKFHLNQGLVVLALATVCACVGFLPHGSELGLTLTLLVDVLSLVGLVQTLRGLKSPLPGIWRITRAFHPFN